MQNVVIIGAVALGPKAACRFKRLEPESKITMIDQSDLISYGGCGIPYFVSGDLSDPGQLQSTSFHMIRDEKFFRDAKDIDVLVNVRAVSIDRSKKMVLAQNVLDGKNRLFLMISLFSPPEAGQKDYPFPESGSRGFHRVGSQ